MEDKYEWKSSDQLPISEGEKPTSTKRNENLEEDTSTSMINATEAPTFTTTTTTPHTTTTAHLITKTRTSRGEIVEIPEQSTEEGGEHTLEFEILDNTMKKRKPDRYWMDLESDDEVTVVSETKRPNRKERKENGEREKKKEKKRRLPSDADSTPVTTYRRLVKRSKRNHETKPEALRETIILDDSPASTKTTSRIEMREKKERKERKEEEQEPISLDSGVPTHDHVESDYELARRLQAEEEHRVSHRPSLHYFDVESDSDEVYRQHLRNHTAYARHARNVQSRSPPARFNGQLSHYSDVDEVISPLWSDSEDFLNDTEYHPRYSFDVDDSDLEQEERSTHGAEEKEVFSIEDSSREENETRQTRSRTTEQKEKAETKRRRRDKRGEEGRRTRAKEREEMRKRVLRDRELQPRDIGRGTEGRRRIPTRSIYSAGRVPTRRPESVLVDEYGHRIDQGGRRKAPQHRPRSSSPHHRSARLQTLLNAHLHHFAHHQILHGMIPPHVQQHRASNHPLSHLQFQDRDFNADDYELLLQLDKNNVKKVTGEQVISKIRGKKLRNKSELASEGEKPEDLESKTCTICLEEFEIGCYYKRLACSHIYHSECIDAWLKQSCQCPICKMDVTQHR